MSLMACWRWMLVQKYNMFVAQIGCAAFGVLALLMFGPGWLARGTALSASIAFMIATGALHPPGIPLSLIASLHMCICVVHACICAFVLWFCSFVLCLRARARKLIGSWASTLEWLKPKCYLPVKKARACLVLWKWEGKKSVSEKWRWEMWNCSKKLRFMQFLFPTFGCNVKV